VPDAVLLVTDIEAGRFPTHCVLTGEPTTTATHVWATTTPRVVALFGVVGVGALRLLGRPTLRVPIPVTEHPYRIWRNRSAAWQVATSFGVGLLALAVATASTTLAVFSVLVITASVGLRARAHSSFWVSAVLRPAVGHVILRRVHPAFDEEARRMFVRRL